MTEIIPRNLSYIKIDNNVILIEKLIRELVLEPRLNALEWSKITKQTPNMKIGYPGQHLASLITGVQGVRTGARGDDLEDGTEIKSCSRVDQLDTCKNCKEKVSRSENICANCGSENIDRKNDSKWLFSIKSEAELKLLTEKVDRVFLTIADYPNFDNKDFDTVRLQAFEIWNTPRHKRFSEIMENYYNKIFLEHIKATPNKTPAPKNFWPYSYQFYLCNPIKVFQSTILNSNTTPEIQIEHYIEPHIDRVGLVSEDMPSSLLNLDEWKSLLERAPESLLAENLVNTNLSEFKNLLNHKTFQKKELILALPLIGESLRDYIPLRDTDKISTAKTQYQRR